MEHKLDKHTRIDDNTTNNQKNDVYMRDVNELNRLEADLKSNKSIKTYTLTQIPQKKKRNHAKMISINFILINS